MTRRLVILSGSYRSHGITEQALDIVESRARRQGWEVQRVRLVERRIEYCRNCRACLQTPGEARGRCAIQDDVPRLIDAVDTADALVLASPTNFFDVTAITRAFLERLVGAGYWPWGRMGPAWRRSKPARPSLLMTSTAMPAIFARFFTRTMKSLADASKCLDAKPIGRVYMGMVAQSPNEAMAPALQRRVLRATDRLLAIPAR